MKKLMIMFLSYMAIMTAVSITFIVTSCNKEEDPTPQTSVESKDNTPTIDPCSLLTPGEIGSVSDIDGNSYKTVVIGCQKWMKENLSTTTLENGTSLTEVTDLSDWDNTYEPAYTVQNGVTYYNGYISVKASDNVCPTGWHIPTDSEITVLTEYLIDNGHEGKIAEVLKSSTGWSTDNGTDDYDLSITPDGYVNNNGVWAIGEEGSFWTTKNNNQNWYAMLDDRADFNINSTTRYTGIPVRCVQD